MVSLHKKWQILRIADWSICGQCFVDIVGGHEREAVLTCVLCNGLLGATRVDSLGFCDG